MSNVRFLKGVRTRYKNSIQTEIQNEKKILLSEVNKPDEQSFVLEATKCADKLKMYVEKLEIQSGKLASALEDEGEAIDNIVDEDCKLCSMAMDCYLDLTQFKERRKLDSVSMTKFKKYVKDVYLADDLPFGNESSEIDLLIGNDYYLDLILARRLEVQPGLYFLASKLGWMVTGRVKNTDDQAIETGLLIMSHTNGNELQEQKSISKKDYGVLSSQMEIRIYCFDTGENTTTKFVEEKTDWDDALCDEDLYKWNDIKCDLERIPKCAISRSIVLESDSKNVQYQLLCFWDASGSAYSAAIYLHQRDENHSRCD
ncbi:unnamed protein product [Mytilus coruscus]|uniref:Peptidase aspartic putative domain-containing protein n=1 Tax=Mytilus coruscus TaxID=42192 RepID=A0A6J8E7H3_MYTCO|nr:unnamed protein product [Mytilus coruscus]